MNYINFEGGLMVMVWAIIRYGTVFIIGFIIGVLLTLFFKA